MRHLAKSRWVRLVTFVAALALVIAACAPQQTPQATQTAGSTKPASPATQPPPQTTQPTLSPKPAPQTTQTSESPKPAAAAPQKGGTLRLGFDGETTGLDGFKVAGAQVERYARFVYNTLVNSDDKAGVAPELAESWSSSDNKTYLFKLRKGVKFHDGTDFNAEAVKFNFDRMMSPESLALSRDYLPTAGVTSIEVVDDYTVKINLKAPNAALPGYLTNSAITSIYSPAGVKKWGDQYLLHPVGTGPFELVEWVKGDHMTLKRFDGYWRKDDKGNQLPYLDQIILRPIPDETVRLNALRAGDLDMVDYIGPADEGTVRADSNLKSVPWGNSRMSLILSCTGGVFDNKALRQAVAWAIDRDAIHRAVYGGTGSVAQGMLDPNHWAFDPQGKLYTRDVAKAKEKLAEGGKPTGFKFEAQQYNTPIDLRMAQVMKDQLAEVGIVMEIKPNERALQGTVLPSRKFEAAFTLGYGLPADPDIELNAKLRGGGARNYGNCSNSEADMLLDKAQQSVQQAERKALYAKLQAIISDESPHVFVHHSALITAMRKTVQGFVANTDLNHLVFDWIWLQK